MLNVEKIGAVPKERGRAKRILVDSGYLRQSNLENFVAAKIEPLIAMRAQLQSLSLQLEAAFHRCYPRAPATDARTCIRYLRASIRSI
jgi:hypothetical protein